MLLANMSVAQLIGLAFPDNALLRRHPTPQDRQLGELEAAAEKLVRSKFPLSSLMLQFLSPLPWAKGSLSSAPLQRPHAC